MNTPNNTLLSTSSLSGDNVVNATGESIGSIKDLMLDTDGGRVAYAVLSFGGFLGLGDKLFAVPFDALQVDRANKRVILDVPKEKLQSAEGFDKDTWPNFADPTFRERTYTHYGVKPYWN